MDKFDSAKPHFSFILLSDFIESTTQDMLFNIAVKI